MTQQTMPLRGINPDLSAQFDRAAYLEQRRQDALYTYKRDRTREVSRAAWACAQAWAAAGSAA